MLLDKLTFALATTYFTVSLPTKQIILRWTGTRNTKNVNHDVNEWLRNYFSNFLEQMPQESR